jgi:dipeptidase E
MANDLLLFSNSRVHGRGIFEHATEALAAFLTGCATVHFAPWAGGDHGGYTAAIAGVLEPLGVRTVGLHAVDEPREALASAEVLFVGGGNSFRLVRALHQYDLLETVRRRVRSGELRYIGSSAGTNMACPTMRTTNDMPIVQPPSFEAFGLIPFQINPHFVEADPASTHMGETREERIAEFLAENDVAVLGLREGAWLGRRGDELRLHGASGAVLFRRGREPEPCRDGDDLSSLLALRPRFDRPA